jgi:hypothetical protein
MIAELGDFIKLKHEEFGKINIPKHALPCARYKGETIRLRVRIKEGKTNVFRVSIGGKLVQTLSIRHKCHLESTMSPFRHVGIHS